MSTAAHLVVVCHANVARSAAAGLLLGGSIDERGSPIIIRSAGTHASLGQPVSTPAVAALSAHLGGNDAIKAHRSRPLSSDDVTWADLVVTMEGSQVRYVRRIHEAAAPRTATLVHLANELPQDARPLRDRIAAMRLDELDVGDEGDVVDPVGGDEASYRATVEELASLCAALRTRLAG